MRFLLIGLTFLTFNVSVYAEANSLTKARARYCQEKLSSKHSIQRILSNPMNHLSFQNQGGLLEGGVCWWHSRFTRAAAYLAIFDPAQPKPNQEEAKEIINTIRKRKDVVVIPGYRNLYEFSLEWGEEILDKLEDWQKSDSLTRFSWFNGMTKEKDLDPEKLEKKMDELFERISNGEAVYQMLQMPGIVAHAWIAIGMEKTASGYLVHAIDSNAPGQVIQFPYFKGSSRLDYILIPGHTLVPYTGHTKEERKLRKKLNQECGRSFDEN
jgi:hypothetical protein